jgi:hypothetical protein
VCGGAQDPDTPGGMLDHREDAQARPGRGTGLEQIAGKQRLGLTVQEVGPGRALAFRCGRDVVLWEDLPDG